MTSLKNKTFNIHPFQFENKYDLTTEEGDLRLYKTPTGKKYPSITSVLSYAKSAEKEYILNEWKEFVGEQGAEDIRVYSATRGSFVHDTLEQYVLGTDEYQKLYDALSNKNKRLFNQVKKVLEKVDNVRLLEKPLFSSKMKVAGRVDMIAEFNGKLSVVDFKTSTKLKDKSQAFDYFIQETFYALAYYELYGEKIEQIVTIIATENSMKAKVFIEDPKDYYKHLAEKLQTFFTKLKNNKLILEKK